MSGWKELAEEFDAWRNAGRCAELWLRDDDAGGAEDPLVQLVELCGVYGVPANFAAIPVNSTRATGDLIAALDGARVLVHGYAHADHAGVGERKTEYSDMRSVADVEAEWREAIRLIEAIYGAKSRRVFVPPWNRMSPVLEARLPEVGFEGYSGLGARNSATAHGLVVANVHVDMIDSRRHAFRGSDAALASIVQHLRDKRVGAADAAEPTGVMTHHLVLDSEAWSFLRQLFACTTGQTGIRWCSGDEIFGNA